MSFLEISETSRTHRESPPRTPLSVIGNLRFLHALPLGHRRFRVAASLPAQSSQNRARNAPRQLLNQPREEICASSSHIRAAPVCGRRELMPLVS
jgi:hypothetical protein